MNERKMALKTFLDRSHSVYHAVEQLRQLLAAEGYTGLSEGEKWELVPGGKYYVVRGGSALIAFRIPTAAPVGFMLSASHGDRPPLR